MGSERKRRSAAGRFDPFISDFPLSYTQEARTLRSEKKLKCADNQYFVNLFYNDDGTVDMEDYWTAINGFSCTFSTVEEAETEAARLIEIYNEDPFPMVTSRNTPTVHLIGSEDIVSEYNFGDIEDEAKKKLKSLITSDENFRVMGQCRLSNLSFEITGFAGKLRIVVRDAMRELPGLIFEAMDGCERDSVTDEQISEIESLLIENWDFSTSAERTAILSRTAGFTAVKKNLLKLAEDVDKRLDKSFEICVTATQSVIHPEGEMSK